MTETVPTAAPPSRKKLLWGLAGAAGVAAVALVVFILPAEYGIDPTGAGSALGLTKLAEPGLSEEQIRGNERTGVLTLSDTRDRAQVHARPGRPDRVLVAGDGAALLRHAFASLRGRRRAHRNL